MKSFQFRHRLLSAVLSGAMCLSLFLSGCTGERDTRPVWVLATASPEDTVTQLFAERFAQENPYEVIVSNRLYEQQDYIVETNHLPHLISLIVNDKLFQSFSEEDQAILTQAAQTATQYAREQSDVRISQRIDTIEESGTQIITLSQQLRDEIRERCQGVYKAIEQAISPELYQGYTQ